jgi:hypothetical protein
MIDKSATRAHLSADLVVYQREEPLF